MSRQPHAITVNPNRCSIVLLMRRAWWANSKGYPRFKGWTLDPAYCPDPHYQALVTAWYETLDDKAKAFLGRTYKGFANPPKPTRE